MNPLALLHRKPRPGLPDRVRALSFERDYLGGAATQTGGTLKYLDGGTMRTCRVSMTWAALAVLRQELRRAGTSCPDEMILGRCLALWACELLDGNAVLRAAAGPEGLVLDFNGGPANNQARYLLERSGLLASVARKTSPRADLPGPHSDCQQSPILQDLDKSCKRVPVHVSSGDRLRPYRRLDARQRRGGRAIDGLRS